MCLAPLCVNVFFENLRHVSFNNVAIMRQMSRVVMAAVLVVLLSWGSVARGFAQEATGRPFITKWQGKAGEVLKLPIVGTNYKLVIKNEAGEVVKTEEKVTVTGEDDSFYSPFTPTADGVYTVEVGPAGVKYMRMKAELKGEGILQKYIRLTSNDQLLEVVQFGTVAWESMKQMFYWCENMTFAAGIDTPDLTKVTDMGGMFAFCYAFNQPLEKWNVSQVTNMSGMFKVCIAFNQPLEKWTVSQVTNMSEMFSECIAFNQPLEKWTVSQVTSMERMFDYCTAFNQPLEKWDVSQVTSMYRMFNECNSFNQPLNNWDVSQVTDMSQMFAYCSAFNQPLEKWDVSKVTNMRGMFWMCYAFNQPLNNWNVSQVTNMRGMFLGCTAFNQPLEKWDVSNVTDMGIMFSDCSAFNQPLEKWDVSQVTDMSQMFEACTAFNQPLEKWDVSKVTNMSWMFKVCSAFNQPLEKWTVSQVTDMSEMFWNCSAFNQPLEKWEVSKVTKMSGMFAYCSAFNQPLNSWNVSKVTNMGEMFKECKSFNQPLGEWDVSQVTNMSQMFSHCSAFNQPLEKWDVSKVTNMSWMFKVCSAFNQPLNSWNVSKVTNMGEMFKECKSFNQPLGTWKLQTAIGGLSTTAMSVKNYSLSLIGWANQTDGASNIQFGKEVEGLIYNDAGREAREKLIARGWTFEGDVYKPSDVAITLVKEGEGTLAIEGYNDEALKAVAVGTELTVIATPKEGYTLTSLTAGTQDIFATKKFTVTGAVTVKAVFKKKTVAITLAKEGEGTFAIEGYNDAALQAVAEGTELTVIATPKEGYTLTSLTAGTQDILATKKFTVTGAVTVKAVFKKKENNGGGNGGGNWQPQTPQAVEDVVLASLVVAPNPFSTQLRIENPEGVAARYELVNAAGVVVRTGAFVATEVFVDTEALPTGVYFVRITGQNGAKRVERVSKY